MSSDKDTIKSCNSVSAGEVCSLAVAENLGIRGDDTNHYKNGYDDVKTYSCLSDINKPYRLCEKNGKPSCLLQKNAGFGFTTDKNNSTCITSECPTGFVEDPNDSDICIKPVRDANVLRSSRIDDRWHDWFMISNYHLGNKYGQDESGTKYKPCKSGSVPSFKTDPVDNMVNYSIDEDISKCINKEQYFEGKYNDSQEYCPLAWIMRAGATKNDYIEIYDGLIDDIIQQNGESDITHELKNSVTTYVENNILNELKDEKYEEYAGFYDTPEIELACKKLEVDSKRLYKPYEICKRVHTDTKENVVNELISKNGLTQTQAEIMYMRTRQACHSVFSDPNGAIMQLEGDEIKPLFFEDVDKKNMDSEIEKKQKEIDKTKTTSENESDTTIIKNTTKYTIWMSIFVIILSLFLFRYRKQIGQLILIIKDIIIIIIKEIGKLIVTIQNLFIVQERKVTTTYRKI